MDMSMDCDSMLLVEGRFGGGIVVEGMSFLTYVINPPPLMLLFVFCFAFGFFIFIFIGHLVCKRCNLGWLDLVFLGEVLFLGLALCQCFVLLVADEVLLV